MTKTDQAAALKDGKKPGPIQDKTQVRDAGPEAMRDEDQPWDKQDEAVDETFPASDATAKY